MRMSSNQHTEKWGRSPIKGIKKKKKGDKDKSISSRRQSSTSWKKKIEP